MQINYRNMGAAKTVTGSSHLLEIKDLEGEKDLKIVIDMGTFQDNTCSFSKLYEINSRKYPVNFEDVSYVLVTHSHADHCDNLGRLPALDFKGKILATSLTAELMEINLLDNCRIHNKDIERENKKKEKKKKHTEMYIPLYTQASIQWVLENTRGYSYDKEIKLNNHVSAKFIPSGHISGASSIVITIKEKDNIRRMLFTGDVSCDRNIPFTKKLDIKDEKFDYIATENTYGDRLIPKTDIVAELKGHITETCMVRNSKILLPVFSIARSTNMLFYLKEVYKYNPQFRDVKIYLVSPMACKSHSVIGKDTSFEFYDEQWKEQKDLWKWANIEYIESFKKLQKIIDIDERCIYCASSGMLSGGLSQFIASKLLPKKTNKIVFCGYQAINSLGRNILEHEQKKITITDVDLKKIEIPINCDIDFIDGCSSHGDYQDIIKAFKSTKYSKIKKIIVTHGQEEVCNIFANKLKKEFNADIYVPNYGETIKLL
jgi:metallo-beta-lactamase family protein